MARSATGAITLTDVADGGSPISAVLSNENHSFAAAASTGAVSTAEKDEPQQELIRTLQSLLLVLTLISSHLEL